MKPWGEPLIFSGRGNEPLATKICNALKMPVAQAEISDFANENIFIQLHQSVRGHDTFIIQGLGPPVNRNLIELFIFIETLKRSSAGRITAVIPFYAYARSDKKDKPRVPITARLMADLIITAGADRYITIDLHAGQIQGFFSIPGDELQAYPLIAEHIKGLNLENPVIVSADLGFAKKARNIAEKLDAPLAFVEKRRISGQAEALTVIGDVENKNVILVDELVETAGTITEAVGLIRRSGATSVRIACTHATLVGPAVERLKASGIAEFICTDTVPLPPDTDLPNLTVLSVAPLLAGVIDRTNKAESVGSFVGDTLDL
ncbi:MAG: ribose-phosphate pyrophosphokinase [Anaerolineae bacterium]|nr:ribose-phosphate pyrophosphokinase [Anaerolineae bacterium]